MKNNIQNIASNPHYSVWVNASAGTGKTKILTDRVLRLLLSGVMPHKILCITFTNNAADEMRRRICEYIDSWRDNKKLEYIYDLTKNYNADIKQIAKTACENYDNAPEPIKIYTIHGLCRSILSRFPLEAQLKKTEFNILSNINFIINKIINDIAISDSEYLKYFAANWQDMKLHELIKEIITYSKELDALIEKFISAENYKKYLSVFLSYNENWQSEFWRSISIDSLKTIEKRNSAKHIYKTIVSKDFNGIVEILLTQKMTKRKNIISKSEAQLYPDLYLELNNLQSKVLSACIEQIKEKVIQGSEALFSLSKEIISKFEYYKKGDLDFADLLAQATKLLTTSHMKEWVLYKLDGGIDHLLLDEAQDTNSQQWEIINAIVEDTYASKQSNKTIFVVGDDKQSIYKFQGADLNGYYKMQKFLSSVFSNINSEFKILNLNISYRSAYNIVSFINDLFSKIFTQHSFAQQFQTLQANRKNHSGYVEFIPIDFEPSNKEKDFWPQPIENQEKKLNVLSVSIAKKIKEILDSKIVLESTQAIVKPSDILILVQKRGEISSDIETALSNIDIAIKGSEKASAKEILPIADLISLGKFIINPEDDLNLAELLKSPLINITESQLYNICKKRESSIWQYLKNADIYQEIYNHLLGIQELYSYANLVDFYQTILDIYGMRSYLGPAAEKFTELVLEFSKNNIPNMQNFIDWMLVDSDEVNIKSYTEESVTWMTIHASKGLQAPIVIIADTELYNKSLGNIFWLSSIALLSCKDINLIEKKNNQNNLNAYSEYMEYIRLLYVALTRAQDYLLIFGDRKSRTDSWCSIITEFLSNNNIEKYQKNFQTSNALPNYQTILEIPQHKAYCKTLPSEKLIYNPTENQHGIKYGVSMHAALEHIVSSGNISQYSPKDIELLLPDVKNKTSAAKRIFDILQLEKFKEWRSGKYNLITEMNISISNNLAGRIDLIAISESHIDIIDYKTDAKPDSKAYLQQLSEYAQAIRNIYPESVKIRLYLIWISTSKIEEVVLI